MDNKIGNFIKELRTERNWSQEDLAAKLYISRQSVSKWEIGQTTPSMSIMIKLAEIFELTLPEIINGERATKDNIEAINSETTKEIIKMHKKTKKITRISSILICILVFAFLGYYFFTSYKTQNIYEVTGRSDNFAINNGLFILTKSRVYFTVQDIKTNEDVKQLTLYVLDNGEKHDIYTSDKNNSIFLEENNGYNEYFSMNNKNIFLKNLYIEIQGEKHTENMKLDLRKIYQNDELLNLNKNNGQDSDKNNFSEIDNDKLINSIKTKFITNVEDYYEFELNKNEFEISFTYLSNTNTLNVNKYSNEDEKYWTYNFNSNLLTYERIETINYETIEQDSANIKENKDFIKEFINIINDYVY